MILIFTSINDLATNNIISELIKLDKKFIRINDETKVELIFDLEKIELTTIKIKEYKLRFLEISSIWVRKGNFFNNLIMSSTNSYISKFLNKELEIFLDFFEFIFKGKFKLSKPQQRNFNKLIFLLKAKQFGLKIPNSVISNSKKHLESYIESLSKIITKPLSDIINPKSDVSMLTKIVNKDKLKDLPNLFFPSLFQKKIESIYEIRTVFLLGKTYSAIIFPQYKNENEPDFRGSPNLDIGLTSFILPEQINKSVCDFMEAIHVEFCSLDILVDKNNEYFIVDLNPFGQFGMISHLYNNEIERRIANYL